MKAADDTKRLVIAAGGTGGHLYMGLAIARELDDRSAQWECVFLGTGSQRDRDIIGSEYPLEKVRVGPLNRVGIKRKLLSVLALPVGFRDASLLLRKLKPEVVVGAGGYSSGPVVLMASWLRIPTLILEPNLLPGLTNRLLYRWVDAAAVAFPETREWLGPKARLTGVPIRNKFFQGPPATAGPPFNLLVFGGSQGSVAINRLVCSALPRLAQLPVTIVHQTGWADLETVRESYAELELAAEVVPYLEDMPDRFRQSHLIVSRAGASTVAEIAASGRASILIPFPAAADDHQMRNAEALERRGAAVILQQEETDGSRFFDVVASLVAEPTRLASMGRAARGLSQPEATTRIVELIFELEGIAG